MVIFNCGTESFFVHHTVIPLWYLHQACCYMSQRLVTDWRTHIHEHIQSDPDLHTPQTRTHLRLTHMHTYIHTLTHTRDTYSDRHTEKHIETQKHKHTPTHTHTHTRLQSWIVRYLAGFYSFDDTALLSRLTKHHLDQQNLNISTMVQISQQFVPLNFF